MNKQLREVLEGKERNYIMPFLWQRGEEEEIIRDEITKVYESGIKAICVEARPHPDFLGPKWWKDMDIIMEEARNRGMKVWMLDDDHFPTGHAAGKLKDAPLELRRLFLSESHIDALGPLMKGSFLLDVGNSMPGVSIDGSIIGVIAGKRNPQNGELTGEFVNVTSHVQEGVLYWDIPQGYWRIFTFREKSGGGSEAQNDYLNPIVPESVRVLIDTVYEAFYNRYKDDFGKTFAGFFSDEPGFYNDKETFNFNSKLGKKHAVLPWSRELPMLLEQEFGVDYLMFLPLLWEDGGTQTSIFRYTYMNLVSKLYAKHFVGQIGEWCRSHGVEYIGHVIEDNNVHARLGSGAGHFFRALSGQDMSGLDVVLWQIVPGFDETPFTWVAGETDSEFFHYGLAKLAASLAHIDPKKKGRTMAEVFGAYGWAEGLKLMKWLTDHMLVRGVNYFVPHAFSQKEFPDPDCPPHMYARGKNPQFRFYRKLNDYTNRISHLLNNGRHIATAAVLYHAEAEWSGEYMYFHKPVKELLRNQIDCDVLPADVIVDSVKVSDNKLQVHNEEYNCFIVPYSEALPGKLLTQLAELADGGLPILFVNRLPIRSSEGFNVEGTLERLSSHKRVLVVPLDQLAGTMREMGFYEIATSGYQPYLRHYHYEHNDLDVFMFFNEHPYQGVQTTVSIPKKGHALIYNAFNNQLSELDTLATSEGVSISLELSPYESVIVLMGEGIENLSTSERRSSQLKQESDVAVLTMKGPWSIAIAASEQYPSFTQWGCTENLSDMSCPDKLPRFSGTFRYETEFEWAVERGSTLLDLGKVYETAEVWVNGQSVGTCICPPYQLEIGRFVRQGRNTLTIEVTNTLVKEHRDFFSQFAQQEPSGLMGPVRLITI